MRREQIAVWRRLPRREEGKCEGPGAGHVQSGAGERKPRRRQGLRGGGSGVGLSRPMCGPWL